MNCLIETCERLVFARGYCSLHYQRQRKHGDPLTTEHHGHTGGGKKTPEYQAWNDMMQRCNNPRHKSYASYGGRGITVSENWKSFESFYQDMGQRPSASHTLERLNNSLGYGIDNCEWQTWKEQSRNRRSNRLIQVGSVTLCIADWADRVSLPHWLIRNRLRQGWTAERAVFTPRTHHQRRHTT